MGNYYTVSDARADGITEAEASDEKLNSIISFAEEFLERVTGRVFYRRPLTLNVDGTDGVALWLLEYRPIEDIDSVKIDGSLLSEDSYVVYKSQGYILIKRSGSSIYTGAYTRFPSGTQNIEVKGTFGYETIPAMVKECIKKLTIREIRPKEKIGQFESEKVSGYSYTLRETKKAKKTGDPDIDKLLNLLAESVAGSFQAI